MCINVDLNMDKNAREDPWGFVYKKLQEKEIISRRK